MSVGFVAVPGRLVGRPGQAPEHLREMGDAIRLRARLRALRTQGVRMFKRLASEALGLSDIGVIVPASDYD